MIWYFIVMHVAEWRIFPWIKTYSDGFQFTWLFFCIGNRDED